MDNKEIIRAQLHRLLDIVLDTNGFEQRDRELTGNMPTTWFEYYGHVNKIEIAINPNGWDGKDYRTPLLNACLDKPLKDEEIERVGTACMKCLNKEKEPSAATDDSNSGNDIIF